MCHDYEPVVLDIEADGLQLLLDLDLGGAPLRVEVLRYKLHELQPIDSLKGARVSFT